METILIISFLTLVAAIALIGYINYKNKKKDYQQSLDIKTPLKTEYTDMEYELATLIRIHRDGIRLKRLTLNDTVSTVCQEHSARMIKISRASHQNAGLRKMKLKKALDIKKSGEIVAYGQSSAQSILNMFLKSPEHKAAIERQYWTDFGLSIEKNILKRNYTTCIFIKK